MAGGCMAGHVFPFQEKLFNVARLVWNSVKQNRQRPREAVKKADGFISRWLGSVLDLASG